MNAGLFRYTVRVVGLMRSINAYVRARSDDQATGIARALYPRQFAYVVQRKVPLTKED